MDVSDLLRRLLHRRWAVALVVLLALGAGLAGAATAGSTQQSSAAVLIVPPTLGEAVSEQNPLLNLDNNLAQLATVLASAMQGSAVADALAAQGADGSFTISTVTGTNPSFAQLSPQLVFTVTAPDAATAGRTARALVAQARDRLKDLQDQAVVPQAARATLVQVVAPTSPEASGSGRLRAAGSFGLVVLVVGLLVVLLLDETLRRRAARAGGPAAGGTLTPRQAKAARAAAAEQARAARAAAGRAAALESSSSDVEAPAAAATPSVTAPERTPPTKAAAKKAAAKKTTGSRTGGNRNRSANAGGSGGQRSRRPR